MNHPRKIISWEARNKDFSLKKRSSHEFNFKGRSESIPNRQNIDFNRFSCENHLSNYPKPIEKPQKSFSPVPSQRIESQTMIPVNSFREGISKPSQRSILGGPESTFEMKPNLSTYDALVPKNDQFVDSGMRQLDNTPLYNSDSDMDMENDIFKIKTLPERDHISDKFSIKTHQRPHENSSFDQNFVIDSGLSEFAPIKPPNAYRQIASINYSAYNENLSGMDQQGSLSRNQNFQFEEDLSFGRSSQKNFIDPRRRMTPRELFNMKMKNGAKEQSLQLNQYFRRSSLSKNTSPFPEPAEIFKNRVPVSERNIVNQPNYSARRFQQMQAQIENPAQKMRYKPTRNLFHSSEKSISINEELLKKNFRIKTSMAQFNHYPPAQSSDKRREFSPFESNEPSQFKKVKKENVVVRKRIPKKKQSREKKKKKSQSKENPEDQKKKKEDERIENNMLESIGMIELGQFKRYRKLLAFLISLFVTGNVKQEAMDLYQEELQILKIIIYRKFKKHIDIK